MSFLKKLSKLFTDSNTGSDAAYWIYARCSRCGEKIRSRVDIANDLSIRYGDRDSDTTYFTRKVLIGEQRCYQSIEVELTFNQGKKIIDRRIKGGEFISEADYFRTS